MGVLHKVVEAAFERARQRAFVGTVRLNGGHHIGTIAVQRQHFGQYRYRMLAIGIHHHHRLALRLRQPGAQGRFFAEIARQPNQPQHGVFRQPRHIIAAHLGQRIAAAVVHNHNLLLPRLRGQKAAQRRQKQRECLGIVVGRNHHR